MATTPEDVTEQYPLSSLQHGMLFHYVQGGREAGVDIEQLEAQLHERIEEDAFTKAWATIGARHSVLRTCFRWERLDAPRQEVLASIPTPVEVRDISMQSAAEQAATLSGFLEADRRRGFDWSQAPLWRVTLFRLADVEYRMVWTYAHAILDSSFGEVLREVFVVYEALLRGETPRLDDRPAYRDHILWVQEDLRSRAEEIKAFWHQHLGGFATPTSFDAVQVPAARADALPPGHDTMKFRVSHETSDQIRRICGERGVRTSTFVDAAWALVLSAFSGEEDIVFGSTRACRRSSIPGAEGIIGLLINTVPMRARVPADKPLLELLDELRLQRQALRGFEHTPLVEVLSCTAIARGTPLFDTIIVFNDAENDVRLKSFGETWRVRDFELHDQTNFSMNLMAYDSAELSFKLSYERRRFECSTVERIGSLFRSVLEAMATKPDATIGEVPRLPHRDLLMLKAFNETDAPIPEPLCVHEAFEAQVDRTPDAVAVVFRGASLTYRELDERANRVASELMALGVGPDRMVGIFVERSLEMVIGLMAILKAGGAYVPMDPAYPRERIAWMIADIDAPVVLTLDRMRASLPPMAGTVLALDSFGSEGIAQRPGRRATASNLAYVIFTSGSTGRPKGVQIEHRNVANFFGGMDAVLGKEPGVWLALTSISFDISVLEIFWTLARGFRVVVQEEATGAIRSVGPTTRKRPIGFSLFYFAADAGETGDKYRLLLEGAKFADTHGFEAVWTPERHFHPFGGLYPNPSVTSAAVAVVTSRIGIRAGSVVLPLHNSIRCAEEWSVVDNLSNGRVGLSFASGWHARDFALAPANFKERRELMSRGIETVRALWRGESARAIGGDGKEVEVRLYPPPVQREPRIWITASGNPETFAMAGRMGASILTNLLVMKPDELVANVAVYRRAYREAHQGEGHVTLMLHTFVGRTLEEVRSKVRRPFLEYLRTSTDLINKTRWELTAFAKADDRQTAGQTTMDLDDLSPEDMDAILDHAFERYFATAGLFGTPESCLATVDRLRDLGVDEIACLIDFGVDSDSVLDSLPRLDELRRRSMQDAESQDIEDYTIPAQIRRYGVTHLQCTPSLLGAIAMDSDAANAIGTLKMLLVGGEPLPPALVERLRTRFPGVLCNMYGPTETTIWSTTSRVELDARITIGKPINNTVIHTVDRHLRPLPVGVPGELLIGGAGVARGYLARPEMTARRFINTPVLDGGARFYRTGDLGRWLPSGEIEFLGRIDHQIKIRGYRIELGEIESVIGEHPAVVETVVVARQGDNGDARLIAYVVPRKDGESSRASITSNWESIWDETYQDTHDKEAGFNTSGWNSSFSGLPFPESEIQAWADLTVERIMTVACENRAHPRVLEIGCGTGMLLFRMAPHAEQYVGVDFSASALGYIQSQVAALGLTNVSLERLAAGDLAQLATRGLFDTIVINSVIQYFPDADYLARVLRTAYPRLKPGGALFVGDVRTRQHLEVFHTAVEIARSECSTTVADLRARVRKRVTEESELVVDPAFFESIARALGDATLERAELKPGRLRNEMTAFRYDAILRKRGGEAQEVSPTPQTVAAPEACSLEAVRALLRDEPAALHVVGIRNARVVKEVRAAELVESGNAGSTVADLQAASITDAPALDPEDIRTLDPRYEGVIEFSPEQADLIDATFRHRTKQPRITRISRGTAVPRSLTPYVNVPAVPAETAEALVPVIRDWVRQRLPEYMVPSAFILIEALPVTANGKIDRQALPAPERNQQTSRRHEPPKNEVERGIVRVLQELLGTSEVGVDDNFFDVGANSLQMVQASIRLRSLLNRPVPLVRMFQYPTARALAAALSDPVQTGDGALKQSQDRAQMRKDALQQLPGRTRVKR